MLALYGPCSQTEKSENLTAISGKRYSRHFDWSNAQGEISPLPKESEFIPIREGEISRFARNDTQVVCRGAAVDFALDSRAEKNYDSRSFPLFPGQNHCCGRYSSMFFSKNWNRRSFFSFAVLGAALLCTNLSCSMIDPLPHPEIVGKNGPLKPMQNDPNTVFVDLFQIRVRFEQRDLLQALWQDPSTCEQVLPVALRRRLSEEGFRVGVQGKMMSRSLARLLEIDKVRLEESSGNSPVEPKTVSGMPGMSAEELLIEPLVSRRQYSFLPGKRWEINAGDEIPEIAIFWNDGGVCGKTFPKAQCLLELAAVPQPDGNGVRFDISPQIQYGEPKQTVRVAHGNLIPEVGRPKWVFDQLKTSVNLLPGQWLLIGASGEKPSGIGRYFFARDKEQPELKLIAIRLSSAQGDSFLGVSELLGVETP